MTTVEEQAIALKEQGNAAFKAGDYDAAVDAYSRALEVDGTQHLCFSNRSAAYLKLGSKSGTPEETKSDLLGKALSDASKCVEISPTWAKGYSRQAAVLQELQRWDEAIDACHKGLELSPDAALEKMRHEVVNRRFQSRLQGTWHGMVDKALGEYEQEMEFLDETRVRVQVLGRALVGMYWVDADKDPHHLNIQVPMAEAPPGMPPAPPVPYIARIDDKGLHICCPFMSMDRPSNFDGPGYCLMQSGPLSQLDEGVEASSLNPEQQQIECAKDLIRALPDSKIEDLSQTDSEEVTKNKLMMQVRFESSMYKVQKKYGEQLMKEVLEATKNGPVPPALVGSPELQQLQEKLNMCGLLDSVEDKAKREERPPERPAERQAQDLEEPAGVEDSAISLTVVGGLVLTMALLGAAAFLWRRRQRQLS